MTIKIISCGKIKEGYFLAAAEEYEKRISPHVKFESILIPSSRIPENPSEKEIFSALQKEAELFRQTVKTVKNPLICALSLNGKQMSSGEFAQFLKRGADSSLNPVFLIGSSCGLSEELCGQADFRLKLSPMTFTHSMAKVILLEQIYRAFNILNNGKYHK